MTRRTRLTAILSTLALVAAGVLATAVPASARPNCDVPNPPPICGDLDPVAKLPDLTASVSGPASATGGTAAGYTARVANLSSTNGATARGVVLRVTTSAGTITAAALSGWSCGVAGTVATCSGGTLANATSAAIPVTVQLPATATSVTVTATADPSGAIEERSETINAGAVTTAVIAPPLPDLVASMTGPASLRGLYANGVWTITVRNVGAVAATPVNVRWLTNWGGTVNANYTTAGAIGFTCIVPPEYVQQLVYCYGTAPLQPGASATITITAVPPVPGSVYGANGAGTATATVDYGGLVTESNETNNAATVATTILP